MSQPAGLGAGSGGANSYSFGAWPMLDKGKSLASNTASGAYDNLIKVYGVNTAIALAAAMGSTAGNDINKVKTFLEGALESSGTTPGGLLAAQQNGAVFNASTGTSTKKAPATTVSPSIDINLGGAGGAAGVSSMTATAQADAFNTVDNTLTQWGLEGMAGWAWGEITAQGDNVNATGVIDDLRQTPQYAAVFPGNVQLMQEGKPIVDEATYKTLETAYQGYAQQWGLPANTLTPQVMGNLIANNVSASEFNQRVQNGYAVASKAPQETRNLLQQYYGINTGDLAAYYLDPANSQTNLLQQTQSAVLGQEALATGFGNLTQSQAENLQQMNMLDSSGNINVAQTTAAFNKAAVLNPLQTAATGTRGQATVTQQQLLDYAFPGQNAAGGTNPATEDAALKLALGARAAGLSGGGGYNLGAKGTSVGRAATEGIAARP